MQSSHNELRATREELRAVRDELRNKAALLDGFHREASEAASFVERLTEECHGLRGDLQRQETLVVQRDGAIACMKDEVCTQWAYGWLAFQRKAANAYPGLDLNFDIPSDEEAKGSFSADCSREPNTPAEARSPSSDARTSLYNSGCFLFTPGFEPEIYETLLLKNIPFCIPLCLHFFLSFSFFFFFLYMRLLLCSA